MAGHLASNKFLSRWSKPDVIATLGARITVPTFAVASAILVYQALHPDFVISVLICTSLVTGTLLLWRPGASPVLMLIFAYHWLQASIGFLSLSFFGKTLNDVSSAHRDLRSSTILTHFALLALVFGMRLAAGPVQRHIAREMRSVVELIPTHNLFRIYVLALLAGIAATMLGIVVPGLSQLTLGISQARWGFYFVLAYAYFTQKGMSGMWFPAAFCLELANGVGGYFADFKTVFFVSLLALAASGTRITLKWLAIGATAAAVLLGMTVVWSAIKVEYRAYLSGGQTTQLVTPGYGDRIVKLVDVLSNMDGGSLQYGATRLLSRASYVEFFGNVVTYVPESVPYENGAILEDAIVRPFTPRMLFPDKVIIDDSARTRQYTGINVAGVYEGSSISLGWAAEFYIDFGPWLMMLPAFMLGCLYGSIERFLINWWRVRGLLGMGLATAALTTVLPLESSITKMIGGLVACFLAICLIAMFAVPRWCPWLVDRRRKAVT